MLRIVSNMQDVEFGNDINQQYTREYKCIYIYISCNEFAKKIIGVKVTPYFAIELCQRSFMLAARQHQAINWTDVGRSQSDKHHSTKFYAKLN